jgi:hypothetical protein
MQVIEISLELAALPAQRAKNQQIYHAAATTENV